MKNIWKLLMVAVMAIAMVGCQQPNNNTENNGNGNASSDSVYSISGAINKISSAWGGSSAAPAFSIMLLDGIAADSIKDGTISSFQDLPVGSPCYQVKNAAGNMSFFTQADGTWKSNYDAVVATVSGANYTLYIDKSKLNKNNIYGLGKDFGATGEGAVTEDVDLSGYTPYIIGLWGNDMTSDASYGGECWSASIYKMKAPAAFPTNAVDAPAEVKFNLKVTGKVNGEDAEWTIKGVKWFTGYKAPYNFYGNTGASGNTTENVTENATLTISLTDITPADWEMSNSGDNAWPTAIAGSTYAKKVKIGATEYWIGFTSLTGTYTIPAN